MRLSARQLDRATLDPQLLLRREPLDVVEAVRRVVALQAQVAASPYLALWNRVADFGPANFDTPFADHAVVKGSLIRLTLHAVVAEDYPAFHHAMLSSLRASRLYDRRFTMSGLFIAEAEASRPRRSTGCLTMRGVDSRQRPLRSWRSWPTASRPSTAATAIGGDRCRAPKSGCCLADASTAIRAHPLCERSNPGRERRPERRLDLPGYRCWVRARPVHHDSSGNHPSGCRGWYSSASDRAHPGSRPDTPGA